MSFNFSLPLDPLAIQSHGHGKVTASSFSVVDIDGCPLGTVYFVHHDAKLPLTLSFLKQSSDFWLSMFKILVLRRTR